MDEFRLRSRIQEARGEGSVDRVLSLRCEIDMPSGSSLYILDAWVDVTLSQGMQIAKGRFLRCNRPFGRGAPPPPKVFADIIIPISPHILQAIEQQRAGQDVSLRISAEALVAQAHHAGETTVLGAPFGMYLEDGTGSGMSYRIPRSDWLTVLRSLNWSDLELLEVPRSAIQGHSRLSRAFQRFREAEACFQSGDWNGTLADCRLAFEAMVKETTGKDSMTAGLEAVQSFISAIPKATAINKTVAEFGSFLHIGRHEYQPRIDVVRTDAALALHVTGSILAYLASQ